MKLSHQDYDQLTVLTLRGDLVTDQTENLQKLAKQRMEANIRDFVLDMAGVEFVDSKGLETLVRLQEQCGEHLGQVRLASTTPNVEKILEITRLAARFDRHADVESAIKSLR